MISTFRPVVHDTHGRQGVPISIGGGGADYAHLITTGTPGFSDVPTALTIGRNLEKLSH